MLTKTLFTQRSALAHQLRSAVQHRSIATAAAKAATTTTSTNNWSHGYSYTSPESDFTAQNVGAAYSTTAAPAWSQSLSYASPESDFTGMASSSSSVVNSSSSPSSNLHNQWSNTLSFASPESDFVTAMEHVQQQQNAIHHEQDPLPRTYAQALKQYDEDEQVPAMVITTATPPHKVVHVNASWERLCGYTRDEALHHPIGSLLQQTQSSSTTSHTPLAARHLVEQLRADDYRVEHEAYLENFTKQGRSFVNHIRVGPLYVTPGEDLPHQKLSESEKKNENNQQPMFLLGILEEVQREDVPLRCVV